MTHFSHYHHRHRLQGAIASLIIAGLAMVPIDTATQMTYHHHHHMLTTVTTLIQDTPEQELGDSALVIAHYLDSDGQPVRLLFPATGEDIPTETVNFHDEIPLLVPSDSPVDDVGTGLLSLSTIGLPPVWPLHTTTMLPLQQYVSSTTGTVDLLAGIHTIPTLSSSELNEQLSGLSTTVDHVLANVLVNSPFIDTNLVDLPDIGLDPDIPLP